MRFEWFIGLRYLKARSSTRFVSFIGLMSMVGVALGVGVLIATMAILTGFSGTIQTKIAGTNAHLLIDRIGPFSEWRETMEKVSAVPGVVAVAPVIEGQVMINSDFGAGGALIKGIDPAREVRVTELAAYMREPKRGRGTPDLLERPETVPSSGALKLPEGSYLPGIILGSGLAGKLLAFPGDAVTVISAEGGLATTAGIAPTSQRFKVVGLFESGMYQIDMNVAFVALKDAQRFYDMEGYVGQLQARVEDLTEVDAVQARVDERLQPPGGDRLYRVESIRDKYRNLFVALKLEKVVTVLLLFFIVMVAAFNILTSLTMVVMEKGREIAILKAMGATAGSVMRLFVFQGLMIGLIGTLAGNALGLGFSEALRRWEFVKLPKDVYYITTVPVDVRGSDLAIINAITLLICLTATLWPARTAAAKDVVEALRYE